jgi:hypothetical protein
MTTAARTEFPAAERFSERINSDEENAELPDMQELSPLRAESAKQIAARRARLGLRQMVVEENTSFPSEIAGALASAGTTEF